MIYYCDILTESIVLSMLMCFMHMVLYDRDSDKSVVKAFVYLISSCMLHSVASVSNDVAIILKASENYRMFFSILYNFAGYLCCHSFTAFFAVCNIKSPILLKRIAWYNNLITLINVIMNAILLHTKMLYYISAEGVYTRGPLFFFSYLLVFVGMIINFIFVLVLTNDWKTKITFVSYTILPMLASVLTIYLPRGIGYIDVAIGISMTILFNNVLIKKREERLKEKALFADYRIKTMLSQIQPHFIYNTLNSISSLCLTDSEQAMVTTSEFADYLRENIDFLNSDNLVPIEKEISHTKVYTEIEMLRFQDRIKVEFDIEDISFEIPFLTIQPMVENAIKHGLCKKKDGGFVKVTVREEKEFYFISIVDNGVGFENTYIGDEKKHYGIELVKTRLENGCNGDLVIQSKPGVGTNVSIYIPQKTD